MITVTFKNKFDVPGSVIANRIEQVMPNILERMEKLKGTSKTYGVTAHYQEYQALFMDGIKLGLEMAGVPNVSWTETSKPEPKEENADSNS